MFVIHRCGGPAATASWQDAGSIRTLLSGEFVVEARSTSRNRKSPLRQAKYLSFHLIHRCAGNAGVITQWESARTSSVVLISATRQYPSVDLFESEDDRLAGALSGAPVRFVRMKVQLPPCQSASAFLTEASTSTRWLC